MTERAHITAADAHSGRTRKNSTAPYVLHPAAAAAVAAPITDIAEANERIRAILNLIDTL